MRQEGDAGISPRPPTHPFAGGGGGYDGCVGERKRSTYCIFENSIEPFLSRGKQLFEPFALIDRSRKAIEQESMTAFWLIQTLVNQRHDDGIVDERTSRESLTDLYAF